MNPRKVISDIEKCSSCSVLYGEVKAHALNGHESDFVFERSRQVIRMIKSALKGVESCSVCAGKIRVIEDHAKLGHK